MKKEEKNDKKRGILHNFTSEYYYGGPYLATHCMASEGKYYSIRFKHQSISTGNRRVLFHN